MANIKCKTAAESVRYYSEYIHAHKGKVYEAFIIFGRQVSIMVLNRDGDRHLSSDDLDSFESRLHTRIFVHDISKYSEQEFEPYRRKFFLSEEDNPENVEEDFNEAKKHHYLVNSHHPEYWKIGKNLILPMDDLAIAEMFLDWIAVSMKFKSNVISWWQSPGGREKLKEFFQPNLLRFIDEVIKITETVWDFSSRDIDADMKKLEDRQDVYPYYCSTGNS